MTFLPRCGECAGCATDGRTPCEPGSVANNAGELLSGGRRLHRDGAEVHHHLGVSAFATHAVVDRRSVVPVDDDVPPEVAAILGCAVLTGGGALLNSAKPAPSDRIMVVGLGGVGMAAVLVAAALRAGTGREVIAVDTVPEKLKIAMELGATAACTPQELAAEKIVAEAVIEAVGNIRAFETAVAATAPGGVTVTVGLPAPDARASISPSPWWPRVAPSSAATSARPSPPATSPNSSACGARANCPSNAWSPPTSASRASITPWTNSPQATRSAR